MYAVTCTMNLVAKELLPYLDTHSLSCVTPNYKSVIGE